MTIEPESIYLADPGDHTVDDLLEDWRWFVGDGPWELLLVTAWGDLVIVSEEGEAHLLDTDNGVRCKLPGKLSSVREIFTDEDVEETFDWAGIVADLQSPDRGGPLKSGQCFGATVPIALSGHVQPGNTARVSLLNHISIQGQLWRQLQDVPPGTAVKSVKTDPERRVIELVFEEHENLEEPKLSGSDSILSRLGRLFRGS